MENTQEYNHPLEYDDEELYIPENIKNIKPVVIIDKELFEEIMGELSYLATCKQITNTDADNILNLLKKVRSEEI